MLTGDPPKPAAIQELSMQANEVVTALERTLIFNGVERSDLDQLARIARISAVPAGHVFFNQGDESDGLYCIVSGIVRILLTAEDGRELTVNLLEDGEVIGEIALIDGLQRSAGAAALTDARVIFIPHQPFLSLLETSSTLSRQVILMLCERLRATNELVNRAIFQDLRHRLLVLLRQLALIHGSVDPKAAVVDLELTQGTLAQMLGASREAVNKQLRALVREGRVAITDHRIQIFNLDREA
jgi:CRP-like cAMP-binding protein